MDNYKTIEQKLRNLEPFRGNSMSARWYGETYVVTSYSTDIAEWVIETPDGEPEEYSVHPRKYSVTTSRHQNLVRRAWGLI